MWKICVHEVLYRVNGVASMSGQISAALDRRLGYDAAVDGRRPFPWQLQTWCFSSVVPNKGRLPSSCPLNTLLQTNTHYTVNREILVLKILPYTSMATKINLTKYFSLRIINATTVSNQRCRQVPMQRCWWFLSFSQSQHNNHERCELPLHSTIDMGDMWVSQR